MSKVKVLISQPGFCRTLRREKSKIGVALGNIDPLGLDPDVDDVGAEFTGVQRRHKTRNIDHEQNTNGVDYAWSRRRGAERSKRRGTDKKWIRIATGQTRKKYKTNPPPSKWAGSPLRPLSSLFLARLDSRPRYFLRPLFIGMHFKTIVIAGISSLAAVAALPSRVSGPHDAHLVPRHHRRIHARKAEPAPSKVKRCATSSSASAEPEEVQPTGEYAGNAAKPTTTKKGSTKTTSAPVETETESSSESSTAEASLPTGGTGGISINDKLLALFPGGTSSGSKWSTNPAFGSAIALSDQALRATKVITRLSHPVVEKSGKKAMEISFEQGAVAYNSKAIGGVSFYALGPASQPITSAKVLTFSFSVFFQDGFKFNKGGKLPGLYGGINDNEATGCSGGRRSDKCWSTRFMWRTNGEAELYAYLPPSAASGNKKAVCSSTNTSCDGDYGWSLGRAKWEWQTGKWQTIAQKVTLNTPGKSDGSVVVYYDGREVYTADNIVIRTSSNSNARGAMVQTFFGGHDASWASPQDQKLWFSDFSMAVLE